jgi:uncharacterized protein YcbK (DUF882 family)
MIGRHIILSIVVATLAAAQPVSAQPPASRFFFSGDGIIRLASEKNENTFSGRYRDADGDYRRAALESIAAVLDAPFDPSRQVISLRLIEYLDYLEDRLNPGARLTITSGYRAPQYNASLRARGALAAKASLHQYGMAVDLVMEGVSAKRLWETVREIGFGGAGYYHGRSVHVDVGPARFWDETTSGVGTGISDDNKLIGIVTDFDVYRPGQAVVLTFIRMTAFPIGVREQFHLIPDRPSADDGDDGLPFDLPCPVPVANRCAQFADIDQMAGLRWQLPATTSPGRYRIRAAFCDPRWNQMPASVRTPVFEIRHPR